MSIKIVGLDDEDTKILESFVDIVTKGIVAITMKKAKDGRITTLSEARIMIDELSMEFACALLSHVMERQNAMSINLAKIWKK